MSGVMYNGVDINFYFWTLIILVLPNISVFKINILRPLKYFRTIHGIYVLIILVVRVREREMEMGKRLLVLGK